MKPYRIGIVGGMGPLAGIELQRLIVEATPASGDQDHLQVLCFTNPQIPDRTQSLRDNDGAAYAEAIIDSIKLLEASGVDVIVLPCNTAHVKLRTIQAATSVPVLSMVDLVSEWISTHLSRGVKIGLLATTGTLQSGVYQQAVPADWIIPETDVLMHIIYETKAGKKSTVLPVLIKLIQQVKAQGGEAVILGCTELSLFYEDLLDLGVLVIDPLRFVANELVRRSGRTPRLSEPSGFRSSTEICV